MTHTNFMIDALSEYVERLAQRVKEVETSVAVNMARMQDRLRQLEAESGRRHRSERIAGLTGPIFAIDPRAQHVREANRALRTKDPIPFDKSLGLP